MQEKKSIKYLFVVNPGSGRNSADSRNAVINNFFKKTGENFEIYILPENFDTKNIKLRIEKINPEYVIAVGGDGTVTMLANILAGTDTPLGILPAGSANGMAKELEIPADPDAALKIISAGNVKACDLIKINDQD